MLSKTALICLQQVADLSSCQPHTTTATIPVRYASLHPPIPTYCKPSAAGPKIHTMVFQNALAYSKLFCCSAKNWIGGYTGDVGWAQYKTVKNWAEVSVVARDTISVVYYSPAAN